MAIDDNTLYGLTGAQVKELPEKLKALAIRGAGAPTTSTVGQVGTLYEDTTNGDLYQLKSIDTTVTPNTYAWEEVGGSPTVVQTTGTSTTDVMSQNAVTNALASAVPTLVQTPGGSMDDVMSQAAVTSMVFSDPPARKQIQIGYASSAMGDCAIGIGHSATGYRRGTVALGAGSIAMAQGEMNIGSNATTDYGYNNSNYRLLTGLYDGQSAHDAATYGQVVSYAAINGAGAPTTDTEGRYVGQLYYDTTNEAMYFLKTIDITTTPATYTWEALGGGGGGPTVVQTTGTSTTDVMSQNAVTSMVFSDPADKYRVRIGNSAYSGAAATVAIGSHAEVQGNNSIAIGAYASAPSSIIHSVALGDNSTVTANGEVSIGGSTLGTNGYNGSQYRLLTNLYDPQNAHDAATKGYVDSSVSAIGAGTRKATSTGWDTSAPLDYVLQQSGSPTFAQGAMFYTGKNLGDFPIYAGIGIRSASTEAEPIPYLLTKTTSDDGSGTTIGNPAAYRLALHSEIPSTFTTNEWNALWA